MIPASIIERAARTLANQRSYAEGWSDDCPTRVREYNWAAFGKSAQAAFAAVPGLDALIEAALVYQPLNDAALAGGAVTTEYRRAKTAILEAALAFAKANREGA